MTAMEGNGTAGNGTEGNGMRGNGTGGSDLGSTDTPSSGIEGRLALVTGAARGIGAEVARALATRGATVAAVDANAAGVRSVADELTRAGHHAAGYVADATDSAAVDDVVRRIEYDLAPVDILVNVAGVLRTGLTVDLTDDDWAAMLGVNTTGVFHFSRAVAKSMIARRSGSIVTVASNAGGVPRMHMSGYAASKAASSLFTRSLGLELAEYGIRCNVVSPGSTETPMLHGTWTDDSDRLATINGSLSAYKVGIPLRKLAQPSDIAGAVVFLASDQAGHITMQDLYVDGGAALHA
jgi:2,3-dihydro-2,3-dihydroxybenzoate dehydrogenase